MKTILFSSILAISISFLGCTSSSNNKVVSKTRYQSVKPTQAILIQDGKYKNSCIICGMNLTSFYRTNHIATTNGKKRQYCSIHCVVDDNERKKTDLKNLKVVDNKTLKFIFAYKAYYVVGSSKPATMSHTSKYAFAKKSDAQEFANKFGGKVMNFNDTYTIAMKDF